MDLKTNKNLATKFVFETVFWYNISKHLKDAAMFLYPSHLAIVRLPYGWFLYKVIRELFLNGLILN